MSAALPTSVSEAPRRIGLSLPELQHAAAAAGGTPLPFEIRDAAPASAMEARLGTTPATARDSAYRSALAGLPEPNRSLTQRGLLAGEALDEGLAGALGLLGSPSVVLDLDVRVGEVQLRGWHRRRGDTVAMLSTIDGVVFELAWCHVDGWPAELARVSAPSAEWQQGQSVVPSYVDLPWELAEAASEAIATDRNDLVPVLVARHSGQTLGTDGAVLPDAEVIRLLTGMAIEAHGRLRAIVGRVRPDAQDVVGLCARTLLADGWRALRPHGDEVRRLEMTAAGPESLAADLAPLLAKAVG